MTVLATLLNGAYSWWLHPLAVHDGSHTWIGAIEGGAGADQRNKVWRVNRQDGQVDVARLAGESSGDDHNAVAVALDADQDELIAFYARHGFEPVTRYQFINRDTLAVGSLQTLSFGGDVTYNQVLQRGGTIWLVVRAVDGATEQWQYRSSTDWGQIWGAVQTLLDFAGFGSTYVIAKPDPVSPAIVHVGVAPHPPNLTHQETHYARINLDSGDITAADGTVLGDFGAVGGPAFQPTDLETVIAPAGGDRTRLLDIGAVGGQPVLAYAIWNGETGDPTYRVRRWDGSTWSEADFELASGPEFGYIPDRRYLGGMQFGPSGQLWTSRNASGDWIVERWAWNGSTYTFDQEVDRSSTRLIRPYVPRGAGQDEIVYQRMSTYPTGSTVGWQGDVLLVTADEGAPPVPGEPGGLPQVAQAEIRTRVTWLSCDLSTGEVITELPDLRGDEVSRVIGRYTSSSLSLPIPTAGTDDMTLAQKALLANTSTQPPRTMIVAIVNQIPAWAGIPLPRDRGSDAEMPLGCVSLEGYLRHRYIGDHTFANVDVSVIAAGLLGDAGNTADGQGIGLIVDAPTIGVTESRSYVDSDDETVYDGLIELMDAGLVEWTIDLDWRTGFVGRIVDKIARVRGRLGVSGTPTAVFSSAVFSSQGASDATYVLREDFSGDRYANVVRLRGTGEGEDQPRSAPAIDTAQLDAGVPLWELRDSAPSNVTSQAALNRHAQQRLERVRGGARVLEITARWDTYLRFGIDWQLGDDIGHELKGHGHPDGLNGTRRAIGFALSIQQGTIRPILQEE